MGWQGVREVSRRVSEGYTVCGAVVAVRRVKAKCQVNRVAESGLTASAVQKRRICVAEYCKSRDTNGNEGRRAGQRTDGNDRAKIRCTWIRHDRRDRMVAEFAKNIPEKCTDKGMVAAVVRYKVSV